MSVKISELPLLSTLSDNDVIAGVDTSADATKKIELSTLKEYTNANIDLTDYVQNTDYANASTGGVIKSNVNGFGVNASTGQPSCSIKTYEQYGSLVNEYFISKGTLDNVLNEKIGSINNVLDAINGEVI